MTDNNKTINFVLMITEENPEQFLLIRNVNDYATHWLGADGMWVAWPEDDDDLAQMFEDFAVPGTLPKFDLEAAREINEDLAAE